MFNLVTDADDPVLGFATRWVEAIASRVDEVSVITMRAGRIDLPPTVRVRSVGAELGFSEPRRALRFYALCADELRRGRPDACFAHMTPLFAAMFAPLARPARIPTLLWYAHGATSRTLAVAERLVDRCVTSTPDGFRLRSQKLKVLQQGIDVERFQGLGGKPDRDRTIVSVGRVAQVKRLIESVDELADLRAGGSDARLLIYGAPATPADEGYLARLRAHIGEAGLSSAVELRGAVPYGRVPRAFTEGRYFLNLSRSGSLDKAILESMVSGCIPVSDNDAFARLARANGWERLVPTGDRPAAKILRELIAAPEAELGSLQDDLSSFVKREHSLDGLADRIVAELEDLSGARR